MFLRRLRTSAALRRSANDVLAAVRAELSHELASSAPSAPPSFHSQVQRHVLLPRSLPLARRSTGGTPFAIQQRMPQVTPLSSPPSQDAPDFVAVSDAPRAQDVLLRRRTDSEEVFVSALLAPLIFQGREPLPRAALMKVFVRKPSATPMLHFDCGAHFVEEDGCDADYAINAVRYHPIAGEAREDKYERPQFR